MRSIRRFPPQFGRPGVSRPSRKCRPRWRTPRPTVFGSRPTRLPATRTAMVPRRGGPGPRFPPAPSGFGTTAVACLADPIRRHSKAAIKTSFSCSGSRVPRFPSRRRLFSSVAESWSLALGCSSSARDQSAIAARWINKRRWLPPVPSVWKRRAGVEDCRNACGRRSIEDDFASRLDEMGNGVPHAQFDQLAPLYAPAILVETFIALRRAMDFDAGNEARHPLLQ